MMELLKFAETELLRSNADRRHPFRYFSLGTHDEFPEIRTVVKRKFEQDWSILFFTDSRTPKVEHIRKNNKVTALFYHPKKQLQIRAKGIAQIIPEETPLYQRYFQQIQSSPALKDYTTAKAPGSPTDDEFQVLYGNKIHFSLIQIIPLYLDILQLGKTQHQRCAYEKTNANWKAIPITP